MPVNVTLAGWTHSDVGAMQLLALITVLCVSLQGYVMEAMPC